LTGSNGWLEREHFAPAVLLPLLNFSRVRLNSRGIHAELSVRAECVWCYELTVVDEGDWRASGAARFRDGVSERVVSVVNKIELDAGCSRNRHREAKYMNPVFVKISRISHRMFRLFRRTHLHIRQFRLLPHFARG